MWCLQIILQLIILTMTLNRNFSLKFFFVASSSLFEELQGVAAHTILRRCCCLHSRLLVRWMTYKVVVGKADVVRKLIRFEAVVSTNNVEELYLKESSKAKFFFSLQFD